MRKRTNNPLPLSEKARFLVLNHSGIDRQTLRPLPLLHDVRRHLHLFSRMASDDVEHSTDYGPSGELCTSFVPTLTVPNESYDTYSLDNRHHGA